MSDIVRKLVTRILIVIAAIFLWIPTFFVMCAMVISDGFGPLISMERLASVAIVYVILSTLYVFSCELIWPANLWWRVGLWIVAASPILLAPGFFSSGYGFSAFPLYCGIPLVSAYISSYVGVRLAGKVRAAWGRFRQSSR
jgi:UPF0716 family protein affecting phage T7 exclusion